MKCGQPLRTSPGLLVAGQSASSAIAPSSQPTRRRVVQPGGFFPRLIATIIDNLILAVVVVPIAFLVLGQTPTHVAAGAEPIPLLDQLKGISGSGSQYTTQQLTQLLQLLAGTSILWLFYYVATWSILGGSPGQLVMSLRVVDAGAKTIGFGRALLRYLLKGFFSFLAPVSAVMVALGKDKRAIHDLLAGTFVIQFLDPRLEDFEAVPAVQPQGQAMPVAPGPAPPVAPQVPQQPYAGAALAAAAVTGPVPTAPKPPAPPVGPPPPAASPAPGVGAPIVPAAPKAPAPAPPTAPAAPDASAFERYAPSMAPAPGTVPDLPVFPTSDPGGYQPMAPAPAAPAPAAPTSAAPPPAQPYAAPFRPDPPPVTTDTTPTTTEPPVTTEPPATTGTPFMSGHWCHGPFGRKRI